jgi:hypothetical protein
MHSGSPLRYAANDGVWAEYGLDPCGLGRLDTLAEAFGRAERREM